MVIQLLLATMEDCELWVQYPLTPMVWWPNCAKSTLKSSNWVGATVAGGRVPSGVYQLVCWLCVTQLQSPVTKLVLLLLAGESLLGCIGWFADSAWPNFKIQQLSWYHCCWREFDSAWSNSCWFSHIFF